MKPKPLVNQKFTLERFPGKGGWTFVCLPGITPDVKRRFGMVKVRGTIDDYEISQYNLMPMRDGRLFLPVRAEIRKRIKKEAGDTVHITLYPDETPVKAPREMIQCLRDEPTAWKFYQSLTEAEQKAYIDWIYTAKKEETKIERLARTVNRLQAGLKRFDADDPKLL
jgi:hypothetical protein